MTEIVAAHLERARELVNHILEYVDEGQLDEYADIAQEAMVNPVAAALAACAREASEKLEPYCRHLNSCKAFPASSERQITRDCDCGLAALERAAGEK